MCFFTVIQHVVGFPEKLYITIPVKILKQYRKISKEFPMVSF
ncbi:hypothetical protein Tmari_0115 [Thermotoga maritima MSB8]|nr:hypothetical protein Tmari_0115 [Thermotoga maritima MSB8]